jgi:hypothetical protein
MGMSWRPELGSIGYFRKPIQRASVDGALQRFGVANLTKTSAGAYTLSAPTSQENGADLIVLSTTAFAHVITGAFNASGTTATFTATVGNRVQFIAIDGRWWVLNATNVTIT